jgi:hypothetical protein
MSFIDDFSKFTWIYLIKNKSDVFQAFQSFQTHVESQFDQKILAMKTNWGGEYEKLNSFFKKIGITLLMFCIQLHRCTELLMYHFTKSILQVSYLYFPKG